MIFTPSGAAFQDQTAEQLGLYQFSDLVFGAGTPKLALVHKDEINIVELPAGNPIERIPIESGEIKTCVFTAPNTIVAGLLAQDSFHYDLETHARGAFPAWNVSQFLPIPYSNHLLISLGDRVGIREKTGTGKWLSFTANKLASVSHWHFSPSGNELLNGTYWATSPMTVWDLSSGQANTLAVPVPGVGIFALSPDGNRIAYYGSEGYPNFKIHVWSRATRSEEFTVPIVVPGRRSLLAFSPDGTRLAAFVGEPESLRLWSVPEGKPIGSTSVEGLYNEFSWSRDGSTIAISQQKSGVIIFDAEQNRVVKSIDPEPGGDLTFRNFGAVQFSPDGSMMAVKGLNTIHVLDTSDWSVTANIPGASGTCFSFSPENRYLAYYAGVPSSGQIRLPSIAIWDLQAKKIVAQDSTSSTGCPITYSPDGKVFAVSRGGGVGILSASTAQTLITLYRFGEGQSSDWLAITPDGLFDGTHGAWNQVSWRFSDQTFDVAPVESFFSEYFYPGLVAAIMAGKRPPTPGDIAAKDRRQPEIKLASADQHDSAGPVASRTAVVRLDLAEAPRDKDHPNVGSGVRDVRLFRNGSLVSMWHEDVLQGKSSAQLQTTVQLVAGENQFTAYGFNHDNIKSSDATLTITGAGSLQRKGTAYILAVGVDHYANSTFDLQFAVADAQAFAQELQHQQEKLSTYDRVQVISLLDSNATRSNLLAAFTRLAGTDTGPLPPSAPAELSKIQPSQPEDAVFVYFAGHGMADGPRFYLIPHDLGYRGSRNAIDAEAMKTLIAHSISDEELDRAFEGIDAGRMVLVIDACNSGQALEAEEKRRGPMNSKGLAQLAYEKGMYILTAAQGYQQAKEISRLGHGLLTYALVEDGLKERKAASSDGTIYLRDWLDYATREVPALQLQWMQEAKKQIAKTTKRGVELLNKDGKPVTDPIELGLQRPRVFYRRESEALPPVVARSDGHN
jgi:WD40 repeat protein/uncharacterized caspase-like protein